MKRLVVVGLLLAGCTQPAEPPATPTPATATPTPAVTTPAEAGWVPFTAPDGSFSVLLPGTVDVQEDEDGFEVGSHAEPGAQVEIDVERFPTPKAAAKKHDEKVKDARTGPVKEKREGNRVILSLTDSKGAPFTNVLILHDTRVLDIMVIGSDDDLQKLLASLELKKPK